MNTTTLPAHQVKVSGWPYGASTPDGYYAKCSCGWAGTVHGRELDASEDGKSHQMMYAWEMSQPPEPGPYKNVYQELLTIFDEEIEKRPTALILWNQAVAVLREDKCLVTQSSRNYATALSRVGLGSPVDEMDNIYNCNCRDCLSKAEQDGVDAYRNYRDERLRGGGAWE